MSEWTQELQDYWKAHCQDNSWKNVPLSVPQKSMLAFIEHIELITTLCNYWEDTAKNNKTLENELLMCRHAAKTFTKLHDEKCRKIDELQSTITDKDAEIIRLRELLKSTYDELNYYVSSFPGITCEDSLLRLNNLRIKLKQENL